MKKDKLLKRTICHEWGHCLQYLLGGYIKFVKGFEIVDSLERVDGHTFIEYAVPCDINTEDTTNVTMMFMYLDNVENISICLAGVIAEKVCGYSKGIVKGTDKQKIASISNDKKFINEIYSEVEDKMTPYKSVLEYLAEKTLENYILTESSKEIHVEVSKEEMILLLKEALTKNSLGTEILDEEGPNIYKIVKPITLGS